MTEIERVCLDMGGFEVNSYVVHASEGDLIVDAGAEPQKILDRLKKPVAAILITHGHRDHFGALDEVRQETNAPVYMHPEDAAGAGVTGYEPLEDSQDLDLAGQIIK
ncbi:MAG TPA: MBL fold metallo-hydrolase, partial [Rubrobacteraceae bacterium]|nr:MBL fold metallo-hydrolase [Rubrobacteraceae bacterium]